MLSETRNHVLIREEHIRNVQAVKVQVLQAGSGIAPFVGGRPFALNISAHVVKAVHTAGAAQVKPCIDKVGREVGTIRYRRCACWYVEYIGQVGRVVGGNRTARWMSSQTISGESYPRS